MSSTENILRSLTSSTSVKFDGALQILDIITEMVSDRVGARICAALYRRQGDEKYRLLAIEDTVGLSTEELPLLEEFLDVFGARKELNDIYLDIEPLLVECQAIQPVVTRLNVKRAYAHVFTPQNGDSAMIVALMDNDERTGIVSARRVCQLAAQQFNVIFQFVELELQQLVVSSFMRVILRLSAMSFDGLRLTDALERIRRLGRELAGVTEVQILSRDSNEPLYYEALNQFELQSATAADLGLALSSEETQSNDCQKSDETLVEEDSSIGAYLYSDGSYLVGLEKGPKPQWILQFQPSEYSNFSEDELRLTKLFGSYSVVALTNHSLLRKQKRANDDLRSAQDRLVEAESLAALGDMATGVAHDFNNLLGGIIGRIELLTSQVEDPELKRHLENIELLASEGAERVKRLQEFAIVAKPSKLNPFNIKEFFSAYAEAKHDWSVAALNKSITVGFSQPSCSSIMIAAKGADIELLLDSLLKNAIEATAKDGVVEVSLTVSDNRATVNVRDTGRGIPSNIKNKIFNPFFSTKSHKGAGLGLSVAHGIAVRHGGAIKAESDSSAIGSTFTTSFPLIDANLQVEEATRSQSEEKRLRIMVVDDDPQIREVLGDMLTLIDQQSDVFPDGPSALKAFEKGKYDFVITDLGMPGMSGLELTAALRKEDPNLPVAMITGWGAQLNQKEMLEKGVFKVVAKPFYLKDVRELIETVSAL